MTETQENISNWFVDNHKYYLTLETIDGIISELTSGKSKTMSELELDIRFWSNMKFKDYELTDLSMIANR
jgi:hypothetical protein